MAPFLRDAEGEDAARNQDILLVNEFANFSDERLVDSLKRFLDRDNPSSLSLRHCGIALAAFDCGSYPAHDVSTAADALAAAVSKEIDGWLKATDKGIVAEKLETFDIHFICVPLPSASKFRSYFLKLLGVKSDS